MIHHEKRKIVLANAFALTVVILWVICSLIIAVFPAFALTVTTWWMHGLALPVALDSGREVGRRCRLISLDQTPEIWIGGAGAAHAPADRAVRRWVVSHHDRLPQEHATKLQLIIPHCHPFLQELISEHSA